MLVCGDRNKLRPMRNAEMWSIGLLSGGLLLLVGLFALEALPIVGVLSTLAAMALLLSAAADLCRVRGV